MKRLNSGLWLGAALSISMLAGCGVLSSNDAGSGCTTDSNCSTGQVCHPILKSCVAGCSGASDCPSEAKTCASLGSSSKFCQCSTDALCNNASSGNVCMAATLMCAPKCGSCPSGFTCDTASGQCSGSVVTDGGTCTFGSCTSGVCDLSSSTCVNSATCSSAAQEPSTCSYSQYCAPAQGGGDYCFEAPWAGAAGQSCNNFGSGAQAILWNPKTDTGPVTYYIERTTPDVSAAAPWCGATDAQLSILVHAYNKYSTFAATGATVPANTYFYVRPDGVTCDITTGCVVAGAAQGRMYRPQSGYTVSSDFKDVTFKLNFCGLTGVTTLSVGFYVTGGNEYCTSITI